MEYLKLQMTDFCPHCQNVQNVKGTLKNREERTVDGGKKYIVRLSYHCEVCNKFVRSEDHELEKTENRPS